MTTSRRSLWASLGPGLIWAGTAIGVSHLVQSTRAGAGYGLALWWVVVLANVTKYPAYEAGIRYVGATGRSLLEGYRRQGRAALVLFLLMTLATMAIVEAAVTIVTAGMASVLVTDAISPLAWSGLLLAACAALLAIGRFHALDLAMKAMVLLLSASTLLAVIVLLPTVDVARLSLWPPLPAMEPVHIGFLVALIGWMPAPFDTAVWHSQWAVARAHEDPSWDHRASRVDFHVGYVGTAILALGFVFLGAAILHGTGHPIPDAPPAYAKLLVDLYAEALGPWARPVILIAAFTTMLSTTLAVSDGFARALAGTVQRFRGPEDPAEPEDRATYLGSLALLMLGGLGIIAFFAASLKGLVDFATTVSFVITPVLAVMNFRAVTSDDVPPEHRPGRLLHAAHLVCIVTMAVFSVGYLGYRFS